VVYELTRGAAGVGKEGIPDRLGAGVAGERAISLFAEKPRGEERPDRVFTIGGVEVPQSLNLPRRETQTGALEVLPPDVFDDGLQGACGHIDVWSVRVIEMS